METTTTAPRLTAYQREERDGNVSDTPTAEHVIATMAAGNPAPVWLTVAAAERIIRTVGTFPDLMLAALEAGHTVNGPIAWYWRGTERRPRPQQQPWEGAHPEFVVPAGALA